MNSGFLDKLIERIGKVSSGDLESYLVRLADEKGFLETIFKAIHEGVIVTDLQGRVSYLNRGACELFGLIRENCMNAPIGESIRGINWESLLGDDKVVSRDVEVFYPLHRFVNFYIEPMRLEKPSTKRPAEGFEHEAVGYVIILRDITENRRSTEETIHNERLSALTLLAAGVAHEIGNPLNSLDIHLQLIDRKLKRLEDPVRKELKEALDVARGEIERLDSIVKQFLGAIRPAMLELAHENINLLVRESVEFLRSEIADRDIGIKLDLRPDLPLAEVDRTQIKQAFFNIIKNAIQAMRPGGFLQIQSEMENQFIRLTFRDTGGGIASEHMSKIFNPYFTTKKSGSGLGLLIVRRIIQEHGGEIDLISHDGEGLEFTLRLPIRDQRVRLLPNSSTGSIKSDQ